LRDSRLSGIHWRNSGRSDCSDERVDDVRRCIGFDREIIDKSADKPFLRTRAHVYKQAIDNPSFEADSDQPSVTSVPRKSIRDKADSTITLS
jgi:hypothetical protein